MVCAGGRPSSYFLFFLNTAIRPPVALRLCHLSLEIPRLIHLPFLLTNLDIVRNSINIHCSTLHSSMGSFLNVFYISSFHVCKRGGPFFFSFFLAVVHFRQMLVSIRQLRLALPECNDYESRVTISLCQYMRSRNAYRQFACMMH